MRSLDTRILRSIGEVSNTEWNALLPAGCAPIMRWEWLAALETSGSAVKARGWEANHLTAWRSGRLVGLAPAWRKYHSLGEYVYDFEWANAAKAMGLSYYPKLLIGVPLSPIGAPRFCAAPGEDLGEIRRHLVHLADQEARATGCSSIHVLFSPAEEASALEELGLQPRSTLQFHWRNQGYRRWDDFLARFTSKRRHQIKRERAAPALRGITIRTVRAPELTEAHAALAWRFYQSTASRYSFGPVQLTADFFRRAFALLPEAVELVVAERHGQPVAGAFNLRSATRLFGRYWGCFEEHPFLHFNVCLYHSIEQCIELGLEVFEPGAGGEHKIARGFEPTVVHSTHLLFDRRLDQAVRRFCRAESLELGRLAARGEQVAGLRALSASDQAAE